MVGVIAAAGILVQFRRFWRTHGCGSGNPLVDFLQLVNDRLNDALWLDRFFHKPPFVPIVGSRGLRAAVVRMDVLENAGVRGVRKIALRILGFAWTTGVLFVVRGSWFVVPAEG
jgi:hypothetical protein